MQKVKNPTFRKEWFNPLYFIIDELLKSGVSEFYIYGGKSSAKSYTVCQIMAIKNYVDSCNSLIYRKQSNIIKTTIRRTFLSAVESVKMGAAWNPMEFEFRTLNNDSVIFKGLDKEVKAKGVEGYSYILWDELDHFTHDEYSQMLLSFRGKVAKAFFGTWNPISITSWVKTKIVDTEEWTDSGLRLPDSNSFVKLNEDKSKALIKTTYKDNYWSAGSPCGTYGFFDDKLIKKYDNIRRTDLYRYNVEVLGEWGVIKPDDPFFKINDYNLGRTIYNPNKPVWTIWDFNKSSTCLVAQIYDEYEDVGEWGFKNKAGGGVYVVEEYQENSVGDRAFTEMAKVIFSKYSHNKIFVTGDRSGKQTGSGRLSAYVTLQNALIELGLPNNSAFFEFVGIQGSNPNHDVSRIHSNRILDLYQENFVIDEKCKNLWSDINRMETDGSGGLNKKQMETSTPRFGDFGDCLRYFFSYALAKKFYKQ
jgi:phage terminase large subunit